MAHEYCSDRKLHDLLAKHGTVDICDGISDAVEELSHHRGINQTRQATEKGMYQQKWEQIQQEENTGASTGQNGWMETSVLGLNSGTSMQCKDSEADFSLPEGHVLKYGKTL